MGGYKENLNSIDKKIIVLALEEDLGPAMQDVTSELLLGEDTRRYKARIISKEKNTIVLCGLAILETLLASSSEEISFQTNFVDGQIIEPGETILILEGPAKDLLIIERTLLNFLQHLSSIATHTARFVKAVEGTVLKILDTRKTTPGLRHLEKYAVHCGGGVNHRVGLYDAIMIKDTHVDLIGGMQKTLSYFAKLPKQNVPVIVEVRNKEELAIVLEYHRFISRILLDNMDIELLTACVKQCKGIISTEASGGITLANIRAIAETGVDFASIGQLTHSAVHVDLSMKCDI
ncbi:MAG: carboxylating nicotinate-nucleotide diphosphorylase [Gammaproteobacteria bacterium]